MFKSRDFKVSCKDNNINLILAPAGDHRATGMVGKIIQTKRRRLGGMALGTLWSSEDISTIKANTAQIIRLIPNCNTKLAFFGAISAENYAPRSRI